MAAVFLQGPASEAAAGAREGQHIADVGNAGHVHDQPLKAQAVAGMLDAAEPAQIQVPLVIAAAHAQLVHAGGQHVQALLALAAADQLADARHQHIRCGHRLAVVVHAHIEALDLLGVVGDKHRLVEDLLGQVALVLGLDVGTPLDLVLELVIVLFQDLDSIGVADAAEVAALHQLQALDQALVHELVEEGQLVGGRS